MKKCRGFWLDDIRKCPFIGDWKVAKSYDEAVSILNEYEFEEVWLDHDLDDQATMGNPPTDKTGRDVLHYMIENNKLPKTPKVYVHSLNPIGAKRMCQELATYYKTYPEFHRYSYLKLSKYLFGTERTF